MEGLISALLFVRSRPRRLDAVTDLRCSAGPAAEAPCILHRVVSLAGGDPEALDVSSSIFFGGSLVAGHPDRDLLARLLNEVAAGTLKVRIAGVYPLREARAALDAIDDGELDPVTVGR